MSDRERCSTRRGDRSWQSRVWVRIAIDRLRRSIWSRRSDSHIVVSHGGNMSDGTDRRTVVSLQRPGRVGPSWRRRLVWLALIVALCVAIIRPDPRILFVASKSDCATTTQSELRSALQLFQRENERIKDPATALCIAKAGYKIEPAGAKQLAKRLLTTSVRSDALQLLGWMARVERKDDEAMKIGRESCRERG